MSGPRILLHIGAHKTGTTSVQKSLASAREILADRGIQYFRDPIFNANNHYVVHHAFTTVPDYHFHTPWFVEKKGLSAEDLRTMLRNEIDAEANGVVISSEDLSILPTDGVAHMRRWFLDTFDPADLRVVAVLRDPVDYLHSSIQQYTKPGLTSVDDILDNDFTNYRFQATPSFAGGAANILLQVYLPLVSRYIEIFGRDACSFLRLDEAGVNGLTNSVLEAGFGPTRSVKELRGNEGMSTEAAVLIATYNSVNHRYDTPGQELPPRNQEMVKLLQRVAGRKARFPIVMSAGELGRVNAAIGEVNDLVGREMMSPIDPERLGGDADDLWHFSRESITSLVQRLEKAIIGPDARLANRYRDAADALADTDPEAAYLLMRRASELKPDGRRIRERLAQMEEALAAIPGVQPPEEESA